MRITDEILEQLRRAYLTMARQARYRPAAPSDGLGNIACPLEELDIETEASDFAADWWEQEESGQYSIGCPDWHDRVAMVYAIEAARACCAGDRRELALDLLKLATRELQRKVPA